jgi:ATP/maltotriose-dependent transcriptional regulator MalT
VANFQLAADPPGLAADVLEVSREMASQVPAELECRGCFELLEVGALLEMRRFDDVVDTLNRIEGDPADDNLPFLVMLYRASVALEKDGLEAMAGHLDRARVLLGSGADVNPENSWYLRELEVRLAIAEGDVENAEAVLRESWPTPPPMSIEAVRISLALAEAHAARGQWQASRGHAEIALEAARTRGMVCYAAEAALRAGEACVQMGDRDGARGYASELELLLPQLGSRDLDERARALGVA